MSNKTRQFKKSGAKICQISAVPSTLWAFYRGLIKRLKEEYDEVVLVASDYPELQRLKDELGVRTFAAELPRKISPIRDLIAIFKLWRFLKREKFDIVHAHTPKGAFIGMVASFLARVPNRVYTVHGSLLPTSHGFKRKLLWVVEWMTGKLATRTLVNSRGLRKHLLEEKLYSPEDLQMLGDGSACGVDLNYFKPDGDFDTRGKQTREKLQIPQNGFVIGFAGRIVPDKGIKTLIQAFEKLLEVAPQSYLLLIGCFETIRDRLDEETIYVIRNNTHIRWNNEFSDDILPFYAAMDIYVLPSRREGLNMTLLEAAALALPTVTTTAIGCADAVEDNITGLVVGIDNAEQLFEAMLRLVRDSELRGKLGRQGRQRVLRLYDSEVLINRHIELYRDLLSENCLKP